MRPPTRIVGSRFAWIRIAATIEVVVVLPWLPAMAMPNFWRINSASNSPRGITGSLRRRASTISGLSGRTAELYTTILAPAKIRGRVTFVNHRAACGQTLRGGREFQIGTGHRIAHIQQHFGEAAHANAADADEVNGLGLKKHFNNVLFRLSLASVNGPD